jgi:hypothetical protein
MSKARKPGRSRKRKAVQRKAGSGGKRKGAGRKKGGKSAKTELRLTKSVEILISGELTPLDFIVAVMRNEDVDLATRFDAAKAAAPYVHPKLAAVAHSGPNGGPIEHEHEIGPMTSAELARRFEEIVSAAAKSAAPQPATAEPPPPTASTSAQQE